MLFWVKRSTCHPRYSLGFTSCFSSLTAFCLICASIYRPTSRKIFVLIDQCVTYWLHWKLTLSGFLPINIISGNGSSTELSLPAGVNPCDLLLPPYKYQVQQRHLTSFVRGNLILIKPELPISVSASYSEQEIKALWMRSGNQTKDSQAKQTSFLLYWENLIIGDFIFANDTETIQPWEAFILNLSHILFKEHYNFLPVFYYVFLEYMKTSTFPTFNLKL